MKTYQEVYEMILEEMYGLKYEELKELSNLCGKLKIDWFRLFYCSEDKINKFPGNSKYSRIKKAKEI